MAYLDNKKTLKYTHKIVFGLVDDQGNNDYITYDEMSEELAAYALKTEVPSKTSDLTNDTHFITRDEMDVAIGTLLDEVAFEEDIPVNLSELNNDEGFITLADIPAIPTKTSDLTNDSGFITQSDIPSIPTKTSDLTNDAGFITQSDIPTIPTNTSDLNNDSGFLTTAVTSFNGSTGAITYTAPVTSVNGQTGAVSIDTGVTSFNGSTGAITYTAPVTSVNGQTGAVSIDTGVTSFNGSTGAITYTAPVTSVNGQTGAVSIDTGVTSFNGSTGAVTYTAPVTSVNGQTGAVTIQSGGVEVYVISRDDMLYDADYYGETAFQNAEAYYNAVSSGNLDCKLYLDIDGGETFEEVIKIYHTEDTDTDPEYGQYNISEYTMTTLYGIYQIGENYYDVLNKEYYSNDLGQPIPTFTYDSTTNSLDITII